MDADLLSIYEARRAAESAWEAFRKFRGTDVSLIDEIVQAMSSAIEPECARLGSLAAEETGYGNAEDKRVKDLFNCLTVADWLRNVRTLGVLWQDDVTKIAAVGEPMGVVAALIPVTNPTSTIIFKVLSAIKSGNAIVCAPHPRGVQCGLETTRVMAQAAEQMGAPRGLIQCLPHVTQEGTAELMRHRRTSVVMAHELDEIAEQIMVSKSFDYGTACVSEQSVIADQSIAQQLRYEIKSRGGYFCTTEESARLADVIFTEELSIRIGSVGQSASHLAQLANITLPPNTRVLLSEQTEIGRQVPLSMEKLNPVLAWYEADDVATGFNLSRQVAELGGWGHTAVVYSDDPDTVAQFGQLPVGRLLVNTPAIMGGMGFSTDLEPSFMLGTGTASGSIVSDNVTAMHLINIKRIAYESRPWRDIYEL